MNNYYLYYCQLGFLEKLVAAGEIGYDASEDNALVPFKIGDSLANVIAKSWDLSVDSMWGIVLFLKIPSEIDKPSLINSEWIENVHFVYSYPEDECLCVSTIAGEGMELLFRDDVSVPSLLGVLCEFVESLKQQGQVIEESLQFESLIKLLERILLTSKGKRYLRELKGKDLDLLSLMDFDIFDVRLESMENKDSIKMFERYLKKAIVSSNFKDICKE